MSFHLKGTHEVVTKGGGLTVDEMAFVVGVLGVECAVGEGRMCTGSGEGVARSGLLVAWAVALGFNFMGIG